MMKLSNTIAGQLITLIVGVVLCSQIFILFMFFFKTDQRLDEYEYNSTRKIIVSTYKALQEMSEEEQKKILPFINSQEVSFFITDQPKADRRVDDIDVAENFFGLFNSVDVYITIQEASLKNILDFWFSIKEEDCFTRDLALSTLDDCPNILFSIRLNENQWLNARTLPPPDELILLLPVIVSILVTIIGITVVVFFVVKRITAPLRALSNAADKMGRGEPIEPLLIQGPRELSSTIGAFNIMHSRLTRFVEDRTKMLAAISHDLRTPITSLRLRTEFVEDAELQKKMTNTLEDMQVMVEACLAFAKQEVHEEENIVIDLVGVLSELADESSHITFSTAVSSFDYACRNVNLKRAIRNLLENAVTYGQKAHMSFECAEEKILVVIQDQGPGIPEDKLEEVFEPFVRLDKARNTETGSVGLGLSIARTITHNHGGKIEAINTNPGLKIIVTLPVT